MQAILRTWESFKESRVRDCMVFPQTSYAEILSVTVLEGRAFKEVIKVK